MCCNSYLKLLLWLTCFQGEYHFIFLLWFDLIMNLFSFPTYKSGNVQVCPIHYLARIAMLIKEMNFVFVFIFVVCPLLFYTWIKELLIHNMTSSLMVRMIDRTQLDLITSVIWVIVCLPVEYASKWKANKVNALHQGHSQGAPFVFGRLMINSLK